MLIREEDTLFAEHLLLDAWSAERESRSEGSILEHHAVAGDTAGHARTRMHGESHEARLSRGAHEPCDLPVGCDAPLGDLADDFIDLLEKRIHTWASRATIVIRQ